VTSAPRSPVADGKRHPGRLTLADNITGRRRDLLIGLRLGSLRLQQPCDGNDLISDFTPGLGGDALDLHDLLIGYAHGSSDPAQFVQLHPNDVTGLGLSTQVLVDADGSADTVPFAVPLAVLHGVIELSLADMIANDNLIL
jgi:hypothetical protein